MEENSNEARIETPVPPRDESYTIRISKRKIKKLFRVILPIMLLISLGLNCALLKALHGGHNYGVMGRNERFTNWSSASVRLEIKENIEQPTITRPDTDVRKNEKDTYRTQEKTRIKDYAKKFSRFSKDFFRDAWK